MKKHADIMVYGLVQGVTFRFSARVVAEHMSVCGYAKNEDCGTVKIEAEAEEDDLLMFIDWCRSGPEDARVEKVEICLSKELKNFEKFESIRGGQFCRF